MNLGIELLACEDQALLIWRNSFLSWILALRLSIVSLALTSRVRIFELLSYEIQAQLIWRDAL